MPKQSQICWAYFGEMVSTPMPQTIVPGRKKKVTPAEPPHPESPKHNFVHTILESWSCRKERRREAEVPRQSGPEPWSKPPSYLSRACDVTYANRADQMTCWNIFNFLRANGKESCAGSRPLEGERAIFRRQNN